MNRLPRATDAASLRPYFGTGCPWALCKEEGPVPSFTFILVAGRIFEVGWIVKCSHPDGSDQGTRSPWMNVDGPEGVGGALRGRRASAPGQLCEEAEPGFWAPSSSIMKPPGELIPVTGPPPVGVSCLMMWIHAGVMPGNVWT